MIGKDTVRTIRWEPSKIWVDVLEMPIYRLKSDKNQPNPQLYQAKGNHPKQAVWVGMKKISRGLFVRFFVVVW